MTGLGAIYAGCTTRARADLTTLAKCEESGFRLKPPPEILSRPPLPATARPGGTRAARTLSRRTAPRTRSGADDATPKLHAPSLARAATQPSTRMTPLGLHRSHCSVRRLGYADPGRAIGSRQPNRAVGTELQSQEDSGPRATGQRLTAAPMVYNSQGPLIDAPGHEAGTLRLGPTNGAVHENQNRFCQSWDPADNDHELSNVPRLNRREYSWSSCETQALPSTFEIATWCRSHFIHTCCTLFIHQPWTHYPPYNFLPQNFVHLLHQMSFALPAPVNPPLALRQRGVQLAWTTTVWSASAPALRQPSVYPLRPPRTPCCSSVPATSAQPPQFHFVFNQNQGP